MSAKEKKKANKAKKQIKIMGGGVKTCYYSKNEENNGKNKSK